MSSSVKNSRFRTDINGLRAWAVIAVLLFHFGIPGFGAGFMGVDIFFVISGFLMTGIIARGMNENRFLLKPFYLARFRRIVPAVATLVGALLILGWFCLPTPDYQELGRQARYALGFMSNVHYNRTAGYFDTGAHEKWLLHTWSLGVEMQFYLVYPLLALIVWKIKPGLKAFFYSLLAIALLSLVWSVIASKQWPTAAFYLLPARAWELAAGGIVYFLGQNSQLKKFGHYLYFIGLALWLAGFILIDRAMPWPSAWALLPVLGTALIILAAQENTLLMGNRLAQWLGDISYSVYLWHWPLVVGLYFASLQHDWAWIAGCFALSLVLGHVSYRYIETPTREGLILFSNGRQAAILFGITVVVLVGAVVIHKEKFDNRLPAAVEIAANEALNGNQRAAKCFNHASPNHNTGCVYGTPKVAAILMGDSHAGAIVSAVGDAAEKHGKGVVMYARSACLTIDNVISVTKEDEEGANACKDLNEWAFKQIEQYPNMPLISISRTARYLVGPNEPDAMKGHQGILVHFGKMYDSLSDPEYIHVFQQALIHTACRIAQQRPMYLMRPIPEFGTSVPRDLARNIMFVHNGQDIKITLAEYHQRNQLVWQAQDEAAKLCGVKILDPLPYLCDDTYCYGSKNGRALYVDDDHLSEYGNKLLVPMFEPVFAQ